MIYVQVSECRAEVLAGRLPTNTCYCPLANPNPMRCRVQTAKLLRQPTTRSITGAKLKKIELVRTFTLFLVQFELKLEAARLALSSVHGEPN
jgi:hypothetical protein